MNVRPCVGVLGTYIGTRMCVALTCWRALTNTTGIVCLNMNCPSSALCEGRFLGNFKTRHNWRMLLGSQQEGLHTIKSGLDCAVVSAACGGLCWEARGQACVSPTARSRLRVWEPEAEAGAPGWVGISTSSRPQEAHVGAAWLSSSSHHNAFGFQCSPRQTYELTRSHLLET